MQARPPLVTPEIRQLIPELSSETNRPIPSDPDQARFRLFDGIATMLTDTVAINWAVLSQDTHCAAAARCQLIAAFRSDPDGVRIYDEV